MPKIQREHLPGDKWAHCRDRAKERQISQSDLFALAEWKAEDPDVPDGDWYKDFGTFKLCGKAIPQHLSIERAGRPWKKLVSLGLPFRAAAAECVDRSCARKNFPAVGNTAGDQALITPIQRDSFSLHDQRITTFDHDHVFIVVVNMGSRSSGFGASPERHLAAVDTVENVALHTGVLPGLRRRFCWTDAS